MMIYSMMIQYDTGMTFFSMIVKDPLCRLVGSKKESCTRFILKKIKEDTLKTLQYNSTLSIQ